ncbi:MAG: hypothetical protein D6741_02350 [Planctomycetota bacterium]|nr:MAG: hypothetical protein D6741_02350 [Planctomycetota bacterium]
MNRIAVFMLFYESASAAASIANHNATQLARWRGLEINYRAGLEELQEKGRLSANRAHQIRQAWKEYSLSINLPEDTVDAVDIFVAAYIDANLEP